MPLPQAHLELRRERGRLGRPRGGGGERPRARRRRGAPRERPGAAAPRRRVHPAGRATAIPHLLPLRGEPAPLPGRLPARRSRGGRKDLARLHLSALRPQRHVRGPASRETEGAARPRVQRLGDLGPAPLGREAALRGPGGEGRAREPEACRAGGGGFAGPRRAGGGAGRRTRAGSLLPQRHRSVCLRLPPLHGRGERPGSFAARCPRGGGSPHLRRDLRHLARHRRPRDRHPAADRRGSGLAREPPGPLPLRGRRSVRSPRARNPRRGPGPPLRHAGRDPPAGRNAVALSPPPTSCSRRTSPTQTAPRSSAARRSSSSTWRWASRSWPPISTRSAGC